MEKKLREGLRTWIEIDKKAIAHNYKAFRAFIPRKVKLLGVVKSNAYGHNLVEFAKELEKLGADYLGVDSVVEGLALRREGVKTPILVLGYTLPEMIEKAVAANIDITVSSFENFKAIKKVLSSSRRPGSKESELDSRLRGNDRVRVHIKVNSGMNRHGFRISDIKKVIASLENNSEIKVSGLYTHFAAAKNPSFPKQTRDQINIFNQWVETFKASGFNPIAHAGATSGALIFPEAHYDMVRIGIGLYGIWPAKEVRAHLQDEINLSPVLSWKTIVGEIGTAAKGESIGYDFTEKFSHDTKIAVLPIGYWHGFPRALSSIGRVIVRGKKAKVLGRVCMDIIMVDVTNIPGVKVGDEVTIIGRDGKEEITIDDMATLIDGSSYELVTRINPLIKRIYR
ncbi:MAG: alanine racemase [bacterium]